jgi:hypothetical protein
MRNALDDLTDPSETARLVGELGSLREELCGREIRIVREEQAGDEGGGLYAGAEHPEAETGGGGGPLLRLAGVSWAFHLAGGFTHMCWSRRSGPFPDIPASPAPWEGQDSAEAARSQCVAKTSRHWMCSSSPAPFSPTFADYPYLGKEPCEDNDVG